MSADDLEGYTQCHWFAGIGGWPFALQLANWPKDMEVWTGSPPCQPFSLAGTNRGYEDERHLAPKWLELVKQRKPATIFAEQVASAASSTRHPWLDDLFDELEGESYATGAAVLPACSVGAPHLRQRLYFAASRVGNTECKRTGRNAGTSTRTEKETQLWSSSYYFEPSSAVSWVYCRDDKIRPIQSGIKPMVDGVSDSMVQSGDFSDEILQNTQQERKLRIHGYGNAIVPQLAAEFIKAYMEAVDELTGD